MHVIHQQELFRQYAQAVNRPCLFLSCVIAGHVCDRNGSDCSVWDREVCELPEAVPFLRDDQQSLSELVCGNPVVIVCEDHSEMYQLFKQTVGDCGPTETNPYSGTVSVFAMTCDDRGNLMDTNT